MKKRRNVLKKQLPLQIKEMIPSLKVAKEMAEYGIKMEAHWCYERWLSARMALCVYTGASKGISLPAPTVEEILQLFKSWEMDYGTRHWKLDIEYDANVRKYTVAWKNKNGVLIDASSDVLAEALSLLAIEMKKRGLL
jgi:hypothetical protein